ncbi:MAG: glucose 1-dehydrogenase [Firmicutes bacterium]|nr:glucose 1-dehydrogenase [Bacillota bacterium]
MSGTADFSDQVVIVSGGAQGIGKGISSAFASRGAHVVILDIDEEALAQQQEVLSAAGASALCLRADVAEELDVDASVNHILQRFGRIDVLVNNAGIVDTRPMARRPMEAWDRLLAVNLRGPYLLAKYCETALRRSNPGAIVNIASTRALMSEANTEPYAASKGGLIALTHALAVSLGPEVRVNAISPGWIEVADWKKTSKRSQPHHRSTDLLQHPVGRVGTPHDIAAACLFLASRDAGFITGANFVVDGGMTIKMIYEP